MNLNKALIVGRVTKDPEVKTTQGGQSVCSFSLATNRTWKNKDGEKQEQTEFHNCVAWGRTAEVITQYAKKGQEILIEGRIQTRKWETKDGSSRQTTEIMVESMQLGAKPHSGEGKPKSEIHEDLDDIGMVEQETPTVEF